MKINIVSPIFSTLAAVAYTNGYQVGGYVVAIFLLVPSLIMRFPFSRESKVTWLISILTEALGMLASTFAFLAIISGDFSGFFILLAYSIAFSVVAEFSKYMTKDRDDVTSAFDPSRRAK